ncbi:Imm45 family immunity protein [Vibrio metschnikovii]|uniref:Imm45 family immunity protein n=1 Tax=Vibrio metschnikovii TaxID=28172 RepID=UPI002FCC085B|nr:hypothetical protein [Vibrio metschnikovii]
MKLVEYRSDSVSRGTVFRFPAMWPYENYLDLLVVSMPDDDSEYGLVISTGHKAGLILVRLPKESEHGDKRAIKTKWLLDNWSKWIYPECDVDNVFILEHYPSPKEMSCINLY